MVKRTVHERRRGNRWGEGFIRKGKYESIVAKES